MRFFSNILAFICIATPAFAGGNGVTSGMRKACIAAYSAVSRSPNESWLRDGSLSYNDAGKPSTLRFKSGATPPYSIVRFSPRGNPVIEISPKDSNVHFFASQANLPGLPKWNPIVSDMSLRTAYDPITAYYKVGREGNVAVVIFNGHHRFDRALRDGSLVYVEVLGYWPESWFPETTFETIRRGR